MSHLRATSLLLAVGCSALTGCAWFAPRVDNPVPGLEEVSLIPVAAHTFEDSIAWTTRLRDNLLRVHGVDRVQVVDPGLTDDTPRPPHQLPIAETSQALLEVRLLDFDPYYPPSATVEVDLYVPSAGRASPDAGLHMDRWGSIQRASSKVARHKVSFTIVVRTDDPQTDLRLRLYAATLTDDDRGYDSVDRILRTSDRFIDFVAFESIRQSFERLGSLIETEGEGKPRAR